MTKSKSRVISSISTVTNPQRQKQESNFDYIQWMFPLDEPSQAVNGAPVLNEFDIDEIRENQLATENLEESAHLF